MHLAQCHLVVDSLLRQNEVPFPHLFCLVSSSAVSSLFHCISSFFEAGFVPHMGYCAPGYAPGIHSSPRHTGLVRLAVPVSDPWAFHLRELLPFWGHVQSCPFALCK